MNGGDIPCIPMYCQHTLKFIDFFKKKQKENLNAKHLDSKSADKEIPSHRLRGSLLSGKDNEQRIYPEQSAISATAMKRTRKTFLLISAYPLDQHCTLPF